MYNNALHGIVMKGRVLMKKYICAILAAALIGAALTGCSNKTPSLEEVEAAIEQGNLTVEDALKRGLVDQEWVDKYSADSSVPMGDKLREVAEFTADTISGEKFESGQIKPVTFFAFIDPADADAQNYFQALVDSYETVTASGADILVCLKSQSKDKPYTDAKFPVILMNDELRAALSENLEMIDDCPNVGGWYVDNAFLSAWYPKVTVDALKSGAASFVKLQQEGVYSSSEGSAMAPMGGE